MIPTELEPIPVYIVFGQEAPLRRAVARAIRAMEPDEEVTMLAGDASGLDAAITRMVEKDDAFYAVLDAPDQEHLDAFVTAATPSIRQGRLGVGGMILVVDASRFRADFLGDDAEGARELVTQFMEATVIVLANTPTMKKADAREVEAIVRCLEPEKVVIRIETLRKMTLDDLIAVIENPWAGVDGELGPKVAAEVIPTEDADTMGYERLAWRIESAVDRDRFMAALADLPDEVIYVGGMVRFPGRIDASVTWIRGVLEIEEIGPELAREMLQILAELGGQPAPDPDATLAASDHGSGLELVGKELPRDQILAGLNACAVDLDVDVA